MKRRLDDYFSKPTKILKTKFLACEKCGDVVFHSIFDVHCCEINKEEKKSTEKICHPVFLRIMQTCQKDISTNLNIEYEGFIGNRHKWRYFFGDAIGAVSKTHYLKLAKLDPREIRLTFSTSHVGQQVYFFDCIENKKFSVGEFKSLIQKAIRRGNRQSAIKTALQFACNFGIQILCRRLCVIMFDDSVLHPDLPLLVWCMGTNDMIYSQEIFESILQIVADCSDSLYRDLSEKTDRNPFSIFEESNLLTKCIMIRAFYRGNKHDIDNLCGFAQVWNKRFDENQGQLVLEKVYNQIKPLQREELMGPYQYLDVTIEGIDAGCSGIIKYLLKNPKVHEYLVKNSVLTNLEEYLKNKLWVNRSDLNSRKYLSDLPEIKNSSDYKKKELMQPDEDFNELVLPFANAYSKNYLLKKFVY